MIEIVDAHQHFWDPRSNYHPWLCDEPPIPFRYGDYRAIRSPYLPSDYFADAGDHKVVKTVYVETEWDPHDPIGETRWAHSVAERHGVPNAVVAQAWLDRDNAADVLKAQAAFPLVRSVRHKPASAPTPADVVPGAPGSMSDPAWQAGYALLGEHGLSFDLQVPCWHLPEAAALARDFPDTQIIINHTGVPADRSAAGVALWRSGMQSMAEHANVAVKISGIGIAGKPWRIEDHRDIVRATIDMFGEDRCMFASNFPVDKLVGSFDAIFSGFESIVQHLPTATQQKLFRDNAVRYYRLD